MLARTTRTRDSVEYVKSVAGKVARDPSAIPAAARWRIARMRKSVEYVKSVAGTAARDPSLIPSIPRRHPLKSSWDQGEPWWTPPAVRYLEANLPTRARVFEWGSGASTVWFARQGAEVLAIESEQPWQERVSERVPEADVRFIAGTDTGTVRSEPELRDRGKHFFDEYVAVIDQFPDATFDVIVIDGIARCECARRAVAKVRPNGFVVLDDSHWEHLFAPAFEVFEGWETRRIRGFKRQPFEVSETTFFRRPG